MELPERVMRTLHEVGWLLSCACRKPGKKVNANT